MSEVGGLVSYEDSRAQQEEERLPLSVWQELGQWETVTTQSMKSHYSKTLNFSKVFFVHYGASLMAQTVNNPLTMQEARVWSLGRENPLEEGMATHSSILAWRIPWTEKPCYIPFFKRVLLSIFTGDLHVACHKSKPQNEVFIDPK